MNSQRLAAALNAIAAGYTMLAEAVEEIAQDEVAADPPAKPARDRAKPSAEEPEGQVEEAGDEVEAREEPAEEEDEAKTIELADLQELGASLIRAGKRDAFKAVMAKHKLKNLSSAEPKKYQKIWDDLKKAGGAEE